MSALLLWLALGLALGAAAGERVRGGWARPLDLAVRAALAGLLFAMGAALGGQPLPARDAGRLALQGVALAVATVAGSLAAVRLAGLLAPRPGVPGEPPGPGGTSARGSGP